MENPANALYDALGLDEEPFGVFYTDTQPENGVAPKPGQPVSLELERAGKINFQEFFGNFSCVLGMLLQARARKTAAYFEAARYGCFGGSFYLGFHKPQIEFIARYVSTGIPGTPVHGERYLDSPEAARRFFTEIEPRTAPKRFCVFKPLSRFEGDEKPELAVFFARGEVLTGLANLAAFVTGDLEVVAAPFGAGCSFMVSWPLYYLAKGQTRAVLGCGDPSARKYMKPDEMTFTVPYALYESFLARWPESFLGAAGAWEAVKKKIARSRKAWGVTGEYGRAGN
jgi:uncharacterized protein (DUF169 family)